MVRAESGLGTTDIHGKGSSTGSDAVIVRRYTQLSPYANRFGGAGGPISQMLENVNDLDRDPREGGGRGETWRVHHPFAQLPSSPSGDFGGPGRSDPLSDYCGGVDVHGVRHRERVPSVRSLKLPGGLGCPPPGLPPPR
jgi:hypothetical protein